MMTRAAAEALQIGIVGMGNRANFARLIHRPDDGVVVTAVADPDPTTFGRAKQWFGDQVVTVTDHRRLADLGLDAAMVMTPDDTHEAIAVDLLSAGLAVYAEKPLAITIDGCDRILAAARDHQSKLYVGHNMRHMGFVQRMRSLVTDGAIGEVKAVWCRHFVGNGGDYYFKDWHADRSRTTSLLLQKGAHDIDIIHWLAGGYSRRVTAMGGLTLYDQITSRGGTPRPPGGKVNFDHWPPLSQRGLNDVIDVEDLEMVTMELDNGVFATYQQCQYTPDYWRNYTVIGTEGRIENFGNAGTGSTVRLWNRRTTYNGDGDHSWEIPPRAGGHGGADTGVIDEFVSFVRDGAATITSPVAARQSVATGVAAAESLRHGSSPQTVPALDPDLGHYFDRGQPTDREV